MGVILRTWRASVEEEGDVLHVRRRSLPWALLPLVVLGAAVLGLGFRVDHPLGVLPLLAFLAMPFAVVGWVLDRERRRLGDQVPRSVTVSKRPTSSGYRGGRDAPSIVVDGRRYDAAHVRGVSIEQAVHERDADSPDAIRWAYTVVVHREGPRALDVLDTRDEALASAVAGKIASALEHPAPRTCARQETLQIPWGTAVALGAVWGFVSLVAVLETLGVRGPAAGVADWLAIAAWVALYALPLTASATWLLRRSLVRVARDEPHAEPAERATQVRVTSAAAATEGAPDAPSAALAPQPPSMHYARGDGEAP